jgi:hypothetical protein
MLLKDRDFEILRHDVIVRGYCPESAPELTSS